LWSNESQHFQAQTACGKFCGKISRHRTPASPLAPAKNAAAVEVRPIIIVFSIIYELRRARLGLKWPFSGRGLKASQMVRVLHKD
jgi:hypothetical protein